GVAGDREPFSFVYARVERTAQGDARVTIKANLGDTSVAQKDAVKPEAKRYLEPLSLDPPPIAKDPAVVYDYDIVYVRAPRSGDGSKAKWAEVGDPRSMEPGASLMLLHPDG